MNEYIIFKIDYSITTINIKTMDNYSHTAGPDKNSAKRIIALKLKKNKSNWKYVSDDDIENTINNMIDNMYPNKDDNYCLGSDLGWVVSVEKNLYNNGIIKLNELNEKKEKQILSALTISFQDKLASYFLWQKESFLHTLYTPHILDQLDSNYNQGYRVIGLLLLLIPLSGIFYPSWLLFSLKVLYISHISGLSYCIYLINQHEKLFNITFNQITGNWTKFIFIAVCYQG